jgi:hypothetical protein
MARGLVALLALMTGPGCVAFVQSRYSVFGFDAWQTATPEQARALSLAVLAVVAVVSAAAGAVGLRFAQRWRAGRDHQPPTGPAPPVE